MTGEKLYEGENWADQAKAALEGFRIWLSELTGQVNTERQRETSGSFGGGRTEGGAGRDGVYKSPEEYYEALKDEEDFGITTAWMREQTPAAAIPIWQGNVGARNIARSIQTGDMSGLADEWKHMTNGEKDILLYYAGKGEWDEASKYLDWLETGLNERAAAVQKEKVGAFAEEHPVISSVLSVPANLLGGVIGTVDLARQNIGRLFTGDPVDYNSEGQRIGEMAAQLRVPVRERIEESADLAIPENVPFVGGRNVAGLLYDTAMDGVDSLTAGKLFHSAEAAGLLLSNSAAGSMARDVAARGGSDDQALAGGLAAGVLEALFERWSIGDLKAMKEIPVTGIKNFARNLAKSAKVNASEEVLTEAANIAFDTLFMGDVSNWQLSIKQYMAQGMSEAEARRQTAMDMAGQVVEAGMSGGLMGLGFGSIGPMENAVGDRVKRFQQIWDEVNRTVETSTGEGRGRKEVEIRLADPEGWGYNDRTEPPLENMGQNGQEEVRTGEDSALDGETEETTTENNLNTINTLDDLLFEPNMLAGVSGDELYSYLIENGYEVQPLSRGSYKGVAFEEGGGFKVNWGGDRILQYHPAKASHHGGAYIKISSGETGTIRIDLDGNIIE